ncbi:O-acyltransferase like protein-like [Varroa jacobsoni]|nr:O-acyltransferase like protein-like isoform X2 [Varroa destructor]XP_022673093.1 O-acyltransferase like protein-like isoform X2 [Varroa destructor]XP_022673103.1 O-acyltransferase like protein-like isoform X2 [Varroa destructor]XP_022703807.1 O-acyltransferase like protein-like [Varroa jacobsoni]XP_022703808.1 O-acyltransferase like protein-like [Varroa jacobsoni]XP_022703809.1 O-acyltransferase like protein-like [Varroa jacobsoni]XP_022703810.1 O-acyltransferase like protein-like [Varroa 
MYGFPVTSVLACAVACLCVVGTNALLEGIPDAGTGSSKTSIKNYLDLLKPGISSLCNFASHDGVASAECLACTDSLKLLIDHFIEQRTWAVMMADALVKPPSGLLSGTFSFVSHYDQCMKIDDQDIDDIVDVTTRYPNLPSIIKGAYCSFKLRLSRNPGFVRPNQTMTEFQETMKKEEGQMDEVRKLQPEFPGFIGLCVPSPCTKLSFQNMGAAIKNMLYKFISDNYSKFPMVVGMDIVSCTTRDTENRISWTFSTQLIVCIFGMLALLVAIGTLVDTYVCITIDRESKDYDVKHTFDYENTGNIVHMLRNCSAVVSLRKLLDSRVSPDTIKCINGVKFFSLFWLIMGNTGQLRAGNMTTNLKEMRKALETMSTQFILNKDLAVDSLCVTAGVLFAFGLSKFDGTKHVLKYTLHRLTKTLPCYYLLLWFLAKCFAGLGTGPTWDIESTRYLAKCDTNWWTNVLLVNNFVRVEEQCIPHAWLLAMLMQGLLLAVIANFFWKRAEDLTHFALGVLVLVTMIVDFIINYANDLGPTTLLREYRQGSRNAYMTHVGMQLYSRGGPFLIGLIVGFIFTQKINRKKTFAKMNRLKTTFMWLMILAATGVTVNATFGWNKGSSSPSPIASAFYDALHRVVFALVTSLLIMMCHAGKGGVFNMLLSWPGFISVGRIWLLIYLINPFVIFYNNGTLRAPQYYTKKQLIIEIFWNFFASIMVSIILHILLVRPFEALEGYVYTLMTGPRNNGSSEDNASRYDEESGKRQYSVESSPQSLKKQPIDYALEVTDDKNEQNERLLRKDQQL